MCKMYDNIEKLCSERGIKAGRLCADLGISRGIISDLKSGRTKKLSAENLSKIAAYFGVSTDYIIGEENEKAPTESGERKFKDDEIMFALSRGGEQEITDEMFEEVKRFAAYVAQRENKSK